MVSRIALLAVAAAAVACAATPAAVGAGPVTFTDPAGDGNGAPDVRTVEVANDAAGVVTVRVALDGFASRSDVVVGLAVDADRNDATGSAALRGADYMLFADTSDHSWSFERWDGSDWADTADSTVKVSAASTGVTFSINRTELGGTGAFDFFLAAIAGDSVDRAPDAGEWSYTVGSGSAPDAQPTWQRTLIPLAAILPRGGRTLAVKGITVMLSDGTTAAPDAVTCRATLAGKPLKGTGRGGCTFAIPRTARGKRFVLVVTVTYHGESITRTYPSKVAG